MALYSPTTRLLSVLALLQSHSRLTGAEIARRLEIHPRTVRRYILVLQDMGIPVEGERGPHGAYSLNRVQRVPPLMFTEPEATALTLGLLAIRDLRFPVEVAALESALAKVERVLPERLLGKARALQETIAFHPRLSSAQVRSDWVTLLSSAAQRLRQVRLRYHSPDGAKSERRYDPYGIVVYEGIWYTAGYCHLRRGLRTFRLDRIGGLEPLESSFDRPEDFDTREFVLASLSARPDAEQVEVLLQTTLEQAQQTVPGEMGTLEAGEHGVIFRRPAVHLDWVAFFLMGLEFPVVVRRPAALRQTLEQMAARALRMTSVPRPGGVPQ